MHAIHFPSAHQFAKVVPGHKRMCFVVWLLAGLQRLVSSICYLTHGAFLFCRLAAAMGLQCAMVLSASQHQGTAASQPQALCWSAAEATAAFETVLWALSWYPEVLHSEPHSVANNLQQLELHEGMLELASARVYGVMHGWKLIATRTLAGRCFTF